MTATASIFIYILTFVASSFFFSCAQKKKRRKWRYRFLLLIALCIPAIVAAYRTAGTDLRTYLSYYDDIKVRKFASGREFLWVILNLISPNKQFMLFLTAFIFLYCSYKSITIFVKENRTMAWVILLLVFYSTFLNIMRQMIAISIIAIGFKYLFKRRYLKYIAVVFIASLFHRSSIFMVLMPIVMLMIRKTKRFEIWVIAAMIAGPLLLPVIFKILSVIGLYEKYSHEGTFNFEPQFMICMLPAVVLYYYTGGRKKHSFVINSLFYIYLLSFPMQTMGFMAKYIDRLTYNFYFVLILLVPMIFDEIKSARKKRLLKRVMYCWFGFYYYSVFFLRGTAGVFPYIKRM